jgi:glycosyltransferase involved in cell wall biosynthesis
MPRVYADADLYVTSSLSEVQSVAALEALSAGLPFVVVQDEAFARIVEENKNGFAVAADVDAFAARVLEIVTQPILQQRMSLASREMSHGFTVEAQAQKLETLYGELIAARIAPSPCARR